ncbi:MAG: hypothetical protein ACLQOO_00205 [Terriglobia bacterium]
MTVNLRGQSVDSAMVVSPVAQPKKPRHDELKGLIELTGHVFSERRTAFSAFIRPPKRGDADLLIQKGLLGRWRWRGGERLLNLKDLLNVLPSSLKRVFENGAILTPLFWCRIVPNSAIFCQNVAEHGIKSTFFATDFVRTDQGLRLGSHPNERRAQTGRQAESIITPARICRQGSQDSRAGRWLVTDMVKLRKLMGGIVPNFPLAFCHFGVKPLLQTNGLSERVSVSGRFLGCKIVPNFDIF